MNKNSEDNQRTEVRIPGVPKTIGILISEIAKALNVSRVDYLRIEIGKLAIAQSKTIPPASSAGKNISSGQNEIRIRNVEPELVKSLDNIADYLGVNRSDFAKAEITKIVNSYPESIRKGF